MSKRAFWTVFTLMFMVAGGISAWYLGGIYVDQLGHGKFLGLDVSAGNSLDNNPTGKFLAEVAFVLGGLLVGFLVSTVIYAELQRLRNAIETMSPQDKIAGGAGVLTGLVLTVLIVAAFGPPLWASLLVAVVLCYMCVAAALSMREQVRMTFFPGVPSSGKTGETLVLRRNS